ncbi:O-antigen ligase family protein [Peribacillus sp. NPDC097206]|uniref:O-antigen ligase family protein n=1 Tax=unclassified Peribacillus TaxID=2675266 RepID=UPI0037F4D6DB
MGYLLGIIIVYQFILLGSEIFNFGRFSGIYSNPNMLSSLSLSTTVCSLWMIFKSNKKFIGWVFFLAGIIVTISTGSRTGLIGLVIILIGSLFILFELKYTLQKIKFIFSIIIVSLVIAFIMNFIDIPALNRLLGEKTVDNSTGFSRGDIWIDGIPIFMEKPLFGWGYGSANYHIYINNPSEFSQWGIHNSFLIILIENGILGSVLYLAFFIFCFIKLKNKYKSLKLEIKQKKFTKIIFLLCIVLLINGMSESFLFSVGNPMSIPFWYSLLTLDIYLKKLSIQK